MAAVASAALTTLVWSRRRPQEPFQFADPAVFEGVAAEREAARDAGIAESGGPAAQRYYLSEEHARRIFGFAHHHAYDPLVYFRDTPHRSDRKAWPEHPDGYFVVETNSLGYHDDELGPPADFEVFVVGDSNTAGVCNRDETYSHVLEGLLAEARPGETVSVVNAGVGGYGFYNYRGAVEKFATRAPAAFVVTIFGGNDFSGVLPLHGIFDGGPRHRWEGDASERRKRALDVSNLLMTHCYNSLMVFKSFPDRVDLALEVSLGLVDEMQAMCAANRVELLFMYLPEPCSFDWDPPIEGAREVREALGLDASDCEMSGRIADRFLEGLAARGIPFVDLRPVLGAVPAPPFWREDLHMNLEAHELTARTLFDRLRQIP